MVSPLRSPDNEPNKVKFAELAKAKLAQVKRAQVKAQVKLANTKFGKIGKSERTDSAPAVMDEDWVKGAYKRWAPVYDHTFGKVATEGRKHGVEIINQSHGRVLEVGVGTGLSLPDYKRSLEIVGIDLSPEMLKKARERVVDEGLTNVTGLHEMDASVLEFPDASFDTVVAMYVMTVVPEPEKVMRELSRVCKPGGDVMLINHFSTEEGVRGWVEKRMAPFGDKLGWRPVFDTDRVMVCPELKLVEKRELRPMGIFTMMRFKKAI